MAITTAMCTSFKSELLQGRHNFHNGSGGGTTTTTGTGNTFKIDALLACSHLNLNC